MENSDKIQGLIAGDGELPVQVAKMAAREGHDVICVALSHKNRDELYKYCKKVYTFGPGEIIKILDALNAENVKQLTFIGKVSKEILFRNPKLDKKAIMLLKQAQKLNDDMVMLILVDELEKNDIKVLDQTLFIKDLLVKKQVFTQLEPTVEQLIDIDYGFHIAKEIGGLDIGQTVVVQNKMILAVEAIEGTDKAITRGAKLANKAHAAVVVKVSKPSQDKRFDIPTVGLRTLKTMKRYGANVLAVEAGETFIVEEEKMINFANKNKMVVVAV
ncbi:MAG: UDP-2,3-diacylglucosamine diphosphatase LpxI [Candidatus Gastranaerophilales bacterium]|nr:UDP-2,3-diacylglucosamine diphosphatase LpxI [Candidatus Gastranaerophilales bacterium]